MLVHVLMLVVVDGVDFDDVSVINMARVAI